MNIGRFHQFHTAFASGYGSFIRSMFISWPSYTTEIYSSNTTTPLSSPMTKSEESLLGSLPSLGAMVGVAITGLVIDNIGRRNGGVLLYIPVLISWVIVNFTTSIKLVLAARFLAGISGGSALVFAPIFTSEVAEDTIRGTLASSSMFLFCAGILVSYIIGWCMTYKSIIWMNLFFSATCVALLALVTESPVYLIRQKRDQDAKLAIAKYRGVPISSIVVLKEFTKLKEQMAPSIELVAVTEADTKLENAEKRNLQNEDITLTKQISTSPFKLLFLEPASRKAFIVVAIVMSIQVFMGNVPVQVYAKSVFIETDPTKADLYTILFAVVMFFGAAISAAITDKIGRRILLISSSGSVFVSLIILGYLLQYKIAPPLVSVFTILLYSFSFMFGAGTIPFVLMAEAFIPEVQSLASIIINELFWLLSFFILAVFPYMNSAFGIYGTFYIFGVVGLVNAIFTYFYLPETNGLSNAQIHDVFLSRKNRLMRI